MNKTDTLKAIEIMLAFVNGSKIECRCKNILTEWKPVIEPLWRFDVMEYRIVERR